MGYYNYYTLEIIEIDREPKKLDILKNLILLDLDWGIGVYMAKYEDVKKNKIKFSSVSHRFEKVIDNLKFISKKFPNLYIELLWTCEDEGVNAGHYVFQDGVNKMPIIDMNLYEFIYNKVKER